MACLVNALPFMQQYSNLNIQQSMSLAVRMRQQFIILFFLVSIGPPFSDIPSSSESTSTQAGRLGLNNMDSIILNLLEYGLSPSTRSAYQSGVRCYQHFACFINFNLGLSLRPLFVILWRTSHNIAWLHHPSASILVAFISAG